MKVKVIMLGKDGKLVESRNKAVKAMATFYEDGKFVGELRFVPSKIKDFTDDGLITLFNKLSKIEKQHTTDQSQGSWKPTYSEDEEEEDEEKKLRKYLMSLDKRILIVSKQTTFEGHKGRWVTLEGGQKVFIREGENLNQALDRVKLTPKISTSVDENHVKFAMGEKGKIGNADIFLHSKSLAISEKDSAYLDIVNIKEDYRGKGYGTKLVNRVESYAKEQDIKMIYINSTHESIGFWDKLGYKPYGKKPEDPIKVREIWNLNRRKKIE